VPDVGDIPDIDGATTTVKFTPLLLAPPTFTTTLPVVAPEGTGALIEVALQLVGVAVVPLNLTVLDPCVAPKFVPVIVTTVPIPPEVGKRLLMAAVATTVNFTPLLAFPFTVTTTLPVVAPEGTGTVIDADRHCVGVAVVPLNLTVLEFWLDPKPDPEIVTEVPAAPDVGERVPILGTACAAALNASKTRNGGMTGTQITRNLTPTASTPSRDFITPALFFGFGYRRRLRPLLDSC